MMDNLFAKIQIRVFENYHKIGYYFRHLNHRRHLPPISDRDYKIVGNIKKEGIYVTSLDQLAIDSVPHLDQIARQVLADYLPAMMIKSATSKCFAELDPIQLASDYPEIFRWGLDPRILNIVENCLGLPVAYLGCNLRHSSPNGLQTGTRLWHLDAEDYNVIRIIIYLNDVGQGGGAFEYIPSTINPTYRSFKGIDDISDRQMQQVIPTSNWKACLGQFGTVIIANTAQIFHHGKVPIDQERTILVYAYASRHPKNLVLCKKSFPAEQLQGFLAEKLSEHELDYLVGWR
jgi:hypothetical protein